MAASLLSAIGLPELATNSLQDYEELAVRITSDPALHADIKARLARNRATFPLFNTARYTRHLEHAYTSMCVRARRGEAPVSFDVPPIS
jgi:predicted O-linked N-acetylglucosamine transferase (SPINDLY family)